MINQVIKETTLYTDEYNKRLKVLNTDSTERDLPQKIISYALGKKLDKIIFNCPEENLDVHLSSGFTLEGKIDGFFRGVDAYCVSYFLEKERSVSQNLEEKDRIIRLCENKANTYIPVKTGYEIRTAVPDDIPQMVKIFKDVFETYPTPVFDERYLEKMMDEKILFKAAFERDRLISLASADMDPINLNAEITDCATYPAFRGKGLLSELICTLEGDLCRQGFYTAYSLSRAINPGINISLSKLGYAYRGRLVNNCNISGGFEDMNIWVKKLN